MLPSFSRKAAMHAKKTLDSDFMDQGNRVAVNYADAVGSVHMVDLVHTVGSLQKTFASLLLGVACGNCAKSWF